MKQILLASIFAMSSFVGYSQRDYDSTIIIHTNDKVNLLKRVKHAFINMDFIVKDLESDTLKTYPREFETNAFIIGTAIIKGEDVILKGVWGSRKQDYFGSSVAPRNYKRVYYYKGSVEWRILFLVAQAIGGELKFEQEK